jgi:glycosyltransferase involved in cell wall biosynthesis
LAAGGDAMGTIAERVTGEDGGFGAGEIGGHRMRLIFVAPSPRHPSGGVAVIYEIATALAGRGHEVHLYHVNFFGATASNLDELAWFTFPDEITHHFTPEGPRDLPSIPDGDVFFGFSFDRQMARQSGVPVVLIQGYRMFDDTIERHAFHAPCPKVCVASWLVDVGVELGVAAKELIHVPIGIDHDRYRVTRPIGARPPRVSFCYSSHLQKGSELAVDVVERVKRAVGDVDVVAFGAQRPEPVLPPWVTYVRQPPPGQLADEIYNGSRVFLCTSWVEGFGLANVEAMASGAALVTTDNGGSHDYAFHDETALVAACGDAATLSDHVINLLEDDARRVALATAGREYVRRFTWERSAEVLEAFLERYVAEPDTYGYAARPV